MQQLSTKEGTYYPNQRSSPWSLLVILIAFGAAFLGGIWLCSSPAPRKAPPRQTLYFFTSSSCPYCTKLENAMENGAVQKELDHFELKRIRGNRSEWQKYGVQVVPTLVAVDEHGKEQGRRQGFMPAERLAKWLSSVR